MHTRLSLHLHDIGQFTTQLLAFKIIVVKSVLLVFEVDSVSLMPFSFTRASTKPIQAPRL